MAARNKPYEQFGPYVLFKRIEQDALGDLWRAGRLEGGQLGATVALRRLSGGNRAALASAAEAVAELLPRLTGPSFARDQIAGNIDGVPFLAWDYAGGRSLRAVIDRARGGRDAAPVALPLDQAIVIAEKAALSLATMSDLRDVSGARLSHGGLIPHFIWISDDGEIRVAGQQLAPGIIASLADAKVSAEVGRYFAPELRSTGVVPKNADVYSLGAILFLLVTGQEPPDAVTASAFVAAVRATKTMAGTPVPDDIRIVLDKSFNLDPSMRYASMGDMKQALTALAHGGKYSATTFNLAFYLSTLLKKEMDAEALERDKEGKLNIAPYLEAPPAVPVAPVLHATPAPEVSRSPLSGGQAKTKSKAPLFAAAAVVVAALAGGAWMMMSRTNAHPATTTTSTNAQMIPKAAPAPAQALPEPILASGSTATSTAPATTTVGDAAAQQKAFEDAVRLKLQTEMSKLNEQYMSDLQRQQSRNAPVATPAAPSAPVTEDRGSVTAAQLDQQRREAARQEVVPETRVPAPAPVQTQTAAANPQPAAPAPIPAAASSVREGDVVLFSALDVAPKATRRINAVYPPIARAQRMSGTVIVSALIDETGTVLDVKVLKGVGRLGMDESAIRALRQARFTSPMKDGKRVKTWWPQTIQFEP